MRRRISLEAIAILSALILGAPAATADDREAQAVDAVPFPPDVGSITGGFRAGRDRGEAFVDVLQPVFAFGKAIFFLNPRFTVAGRDDTETTQDANVGVAYRQVLEGLGAILGANLYYDRGTTPSDNALHRVGLGVELLTKWVDARWNYYHAANGRRLADSLATETTTVAVDRDAAEFRGLPFLSGSRVLQTRTRVAVSETTTTTRKDVFEDVEGAGDGWDGEIGILLPLGESAPEIRAFVGYHDWNLPFRKDPRGLKGRVEARLFPALLLDGEVFEEDDLLGSHYFVGARLELPLALGNLLHGGNPIPDLSESFTFGSPRPLSARMGEMVKRDALLHGGRSGLRRNPDKSQVTEDIEIEVDVSQRTSTVFDFVGVSGPTPNPPPTAGPTNNLFFVRFVFVQPFGRAIFIGPFGTTTTPLRAAALVPPDFPSQALEAAVSALPRERLPALWRVEKIAPTTDDGISYWVISPELYADGRPVEAPTRLGPLPRVPQQAATNSGPQAVVERARRDSSARIDTASLDRERQPRLRLGPH